MFSRIVVFVLTLGAAVASPQQCHVSRSPLLVRGGGIDPKVSVFLFR